MDEEALLAEQAAFLSSSDAPAGKAVRVSPSGPSQPQRDVVTLEGGLLPTPGQAQGIEKELLAEAKRTSSKSRFKQRRAAAKNASQAAADRDGGKEGFDLLDAHDGPRPGMTMSFTGSIIERQVGGPKRPVRMPTTPFPDVFHRHEASLDEACCSAIRRSCLTPNLSGRCKTPRGSCPSWDKTIPPTAMEMGSAWA